MYSNLIKFFDKFNVYVCMLLDKCELCLLGNVYCIYCVL